MLEETQIKLKPWGREIWFAHTDKYAGKILEVKKGHRYSLQYHETKEETQYVVEGKVKFTFGTDKENLQDKILEAGDKIDVKPYTIHRLEALEDTVVFEVSSPELDDVIKIDDDYGRSGKGNNEELDQELAKN
jgi:mannose-6-phosphate isomerase